MGSKLGSREKTSDGSEKWRVTGLCAPLGRNLLGEVTKMKTGWVEIVECLKPRLESGTVITRIFQDSSRAQPHTGG